MSKAEIQILKSDVRELNEQVYAGYKRIIVLLQEIEDLKVQVANQQDVINGLAESARERDRKSNG